MGKIVVGILALFLLIGAFREPIIDGIKGWRTSDTTESFAVVTVAGQTTANTTLAYDLYQASTAEVITITSNTTGTPVASAYTEATKKLLISGLPASESQTLTVNYYAETDDTVMRIIGPFLGFLIFFVTAGLIVWQMWKGKR
jgi:hypothetical protein